MSVFMRTPPTASLRSVLSSDSNPLTKLFSASSPIFFERIGELGSNTCDLAFEVALDVVTEPFDKGISCVLSKNSKILESAELKESLTAFLNVRANASTGVLSPLLGGDLYLLEDAR